MQATPTTPGQAHLVEWRARRIEDPIERLRYLRQATAAEQVVAGEAQSNLRRRAVSHIRGAHRYLRGLAPSLLYFLVLMPAPTPSDTMDTLRWEQSLRSPSGAVDGVYPAAWQVEKTNSYEVYSNGLRIEDQYMISNRPRALYPVFGRAPNRDLSFSWRAGIVGIVYHTTESHMVPFQQEENRDLKRVGRNLLDVVRQNRSYHFVIDRFGRTFRIVNESDAANHAGESIWADAKGAYVNLNDSFLGIAVETETEHGSDNSPASPAQIHALRILTEMLRSKYHIPAADCVTHAQVSVNPDNMRIGYHTDWAGSFPFIQVGLTDNYTIPLPSLYAFGFEYDPVFVKATGARVWAGLLLGEEQVRQQAAAQGLTLQKYRAQLQQRYRQIHTALIAAIHEEKQL
ncbi:MAG TPA: peptidoglycan recognition family protein [Bryobacteraceae bacterium]|nr:peptidoglycan recognition family protein [Bryobacteraceae bacterium]